MAERLELVISGDARELISALQSAGVNVNKFSNQVQDASKGTNMWAGSAGALAKELLGGLALGTLISQAKQFAVASEEAARQQKDAKNALVSYLGSADEYNRVIGLAQQATRGMVNETQLASSSLVLMKSQIAGSAEESARLLNAGTALVNVYSAQGASMELLIRLLNSGNQVLLDNFNITLTQVNAKKAEIEATTDLTGQEARLQAIKEIVIEQGERFANTMSQESIAAGQAAARFEDMQAKLGTALTPAFTAVREEAASFFGELAGALDGVNLAIDTMQRLSDQTTEAGQSTNWLASEQRGLEMGLTTIAHWIIENTVGWDELAARYGASIDQSAGVVDALADQQTGFEDTAAAISYTGEQLGDLLNDQADYFNKINDMEKERSKQYQDFQDDMLNTTTKTNEKVTDLEDRKQKDLDRLFQQFTRDRNQAINRGQMDALGIIEKSYGEEKDKTIKHYDELIAEEKSKGDERRQELINQRNQEQAEYQQHLDELKLKTILGFLETTGQLDQLTGGVTTSAKDAFDLIQAGIIPVTGDFQTTIAGYNQQLTSASVDYRRTQEDNSQAIADALNGVTVATDDQIQAMGISLPNASGASRNALVRDFDQATRSMDKTRDSVKNATNDLHAMEVQAGITAKAVASIPAIGSQGYQHGGSFTVPGFGSGDRPYIVNLEPGEQVNVTPRNVNIQQNNYYANSQAGNPLSFYQLRSMVN